MRRTLALASVAALIGFACPTRAQEEDASSVSPDGKWAYRVVEGEPAIVRAESGEVVQKIAENGGSLPMGTGRVVWAPDSRRLAFNYRIGGRAYTCDVWELARDEWKALPDFESNAHSVTQRISRAEQRDRKRVGVGKDASRRRIMDEWKVLRWLDADTFELLASSRGSVVVDKESEETAYIGGAVLATVRCDNKGGWRVTKMRELTDKQAEKLLQQDEAR